MHNYFIRYRYRQGNKTSLDVFRQDGDSLLEATKTAEQKFKAQGMEYEILYVIDVSDQTAEMVSNLDDVYRQYFIS